MVKVFNLLPTKVLKKLLLFFQQTKGNKGLVIRYILLKCISPKFGENVSIHPNVYIINPENLSIGNNVSVHPFCYIDAVGEIIIGENVSIAHGTTILSSSHNFQDLEVPIKEQGLTFKQTIIEDNVWIGAKVTILFGTRLGSGIIIGANSVVTKDVNSNNIVAGSPAKIIGIRN
ncbi:hypothetical protein CIL05_00080 [Virgibacillus profundi]|uniref:Acyltransferase n=2 Tax=Virgibacillus profundi TaxID=2024555 RepID=A0A2A2IK31_9BACI|nr:hypothetical protein CIL05_00080 [Virgibacillus profundi]PXY55852.1 acyltransferase [Virgibacillus profundi]